MNKLMDAPKSAEDLLGRAPQSMVTDRAGHRDGNKPLALKRLDRNIVLWRNTAGTVNCSRILSHRGAKLSLGRVCDGKHRLRLSRAAIMTAPAS